MVVYVDIKSLHGMVYNFMRGEHASSVQTSNHVVSGCLTIGVCDVHVCNIK